MKPRTLLQKRKEVTLHPRISMNGKVDTDCVREKKYISRGSVIMRCREMWRIHAMKGVKDVKEMISCNESRKMTDSLKLISM